MFAGAAREAVFSNADVIRAVNANFVPVALKAGLVNNPPSDEEGQLYREIGRSRVAPQGICVVNSAGKVLDWAMMFDDDQSVLAFLEHSARRFTEFPDAKKPVAAERYMKFPSAKLADVEDSGKVTVIAEHHPKGRSCPAEPRVPKGTIIARLFGRALDKDGKPMADTISQDHYVEDLFHVPVVMQKTLARVVAEAGTDRFRLADDLSRHLVSHAYLGQLDVHPYDPVPGSKGNLKHCELWAKAETAGNGLVRLSIDGRSEAAGASSEGQDGGDGRKWQHEVKLTWKGTIEMKEVQLTRLLLVAQGSEKLKWGKKNTQLKDQADVTTLPAGHAIDLSCGVRYGIIGEPVADEAAASDAVTADTVPLPLEVPEENRQQVVEALGPPFILFIEKVHKELKLTDEQVEKVDERMKKTVQETQQFFQKMQETEEDKRPRQMQEYRQKANEKLAAFVKKTLSEDQRKRLRQVELQHEGLFALGRPDVQDELKISDEQRKQFMDLVHEGEKKMQSLMQEAQQKGNPNEIRPRLLSVRNQQEGKIEGLLTRAQSKQWRGMLGKLFELEEKRRAERPSTREIPGDAGRHVINALGGAFLIFRDKVMEELKVSADQKKKLLQRLPTYVQETSEHFQSLEGLKPGERANKEHAYRQKVQEKLADFLKETLKDDQLKRLRQLELQQEGLFALLARPDLGEELKIADEQSKQFMAVAQHMQKKMEPLMKEAQSGGNPQEIMPRAMKIRKQHEARIEVILSDAQKKQWIEIRGKPVEFGD